MLPCPPRALSNGLREDRQCRDGPRTTGPKPKGPPKPKAVPLPPSHVPRTESELQLDEDSRAAEWRDRCMFQRLVVGMRERQKSQAHCLVAARRQESLEGKAVSGGPMTSSDWALPPVPRAQPERTRRPLQAEPPAVGGPGHSSDSLLARPAPREPTGAVATSHHLQTVLHRASGLADEVLDAAEDWSISGFEEDSQWGRSSHVQQPAANAYTQPPPQLLQFYQPYMEPKQEDEMEGEVFNFEL